MPYMKPNPSELADILDADDEYRVLRRLRSRPTYSDDDGSEKLLGIYLDVECTGLDYRKDSIIELGMIRFEFSREGKVFHILETFDEYEDPGIPIPDNITVLTGISDEMVRGKQIDDEAVSKFIAEAGIVIAHNASFDRKFMEKRFPAFAEKSWGCSQREVPWREEGIESNKLEYIAYRSGFFYEGHRADIDCLAGIEILSHPLPKSNQLPLTLLLENARKTTYVVWAIGSPFESKDRLKERGYRWNGGEDGRPKSWYKEVDQVDQAGEVEFLKSEIYQREIEPRIDKVTAFQRYSAR